MQIFPSRELVNLPNIALIGFSAILAFIVIHIIASRIEE